MLCQDVTSTRLYRFTSFSELPVVHGFLTRRGGVSPAPWESLNVGGTVGDDVRRVAENRRRAFAALGRRPESAFDVWQVHSAEVIRARAPRAAEVPPKADAIITDNPQVTLFMRFADCVPILLVDPVRRAAGMAHAGWKGTVRKTVLETVRAMGEAFGSRPEDLHAGIGPSIDAHHYPVGPEVVERFQAAFGDAAPEFLTSTNGSEHLDLWGANRWLLEEAGVKRIELAGICTACHLEDWYSHRGEGGRTGRFGALIGLRE